MANSQIKGGKHIVPIEEVLVFIIKCWNNSRVTVYVHTESRAGRDSDGVVESEGGRRVYVDIVSQYLSPSILGGGISIRTRATGKNLKFSCSEWGHFD